MTDPLRSSRSPGRASTARFVLVAADAPPRSSAYPAATRAQIYRALVVLCMAVAALIALGQIASRPLAD